MRHARHVVLVCAIALICFCPPSHCKPAAVRLRLQIHWDAHSARGQAIRTILDEFESTYHDIDVDLLGGAGDDRKLLIQITSGNPPDIIETAYRNVQVLAKANVLRPLDRLAKNKPQFYEPLWELGCHQDRLYGYPWFGHTIQMVYNRDRFQEAGITGPPKTWDELYEIAKRLTRDTNGDGSPDQFGLSLVGKQHADTTWLFTMFLHQSGGQLVEKRGENWRVAVNSPEGLRALRFYLKLVREVCPPNTGNKMGADAMADFRSQLSAIEFQGPWGVTDIWQQPPSTRFRVSAVEAPSGPGGASVELGANMTVIPITCKNPDAAMKLMEYLGSRPAQTLLMEGEKTKTGFVPFRVPVRRDCDDILFFKQHPEFLPFIHGFKNPSIATPIPEWVRIKDEIYAGELNKAILGLTSPAQALRTIEREGNRILSE